MIADYALTDEELLEADALEWEASAAIDFTPPLDTFNPVYIPHLENYARTQIFYGGASSGKSVFLAQRDVADILKGSRNFLICREVGNTMRKSVFAEIKKVVSQWGLNGRFNIRESDLTITCDNGYQMLFAGLDDTEKLKSITPEKGSITDIRVEEATETTPESLKQLAKRQRGGDPDIPKRFTLSFNPILKIHHIYTKYFAPIGWADDQTEYNDGRLSILKTWYIHNEFLTPGDVYDLENEEDSYWYEVYTLGNWGILGDVIFKKWEVRDLSSMASQFTKRNDGLDFGFGGSPAAYGAIHYEKARKEVYVFHEVYGREMTDDVLAGEILPYCDGNYVTCDSAEPKAIATLASHGVKAIPAKKGPGSLEHGYRWLTGQRIIVDKSCINTQTELSLHQWAQDKDGNRLGKPQDKFNHMIAAMRYGLESEMLESQATMRQGRVKGRGTRQRR